MTLNSALVKSTVVAALGGLLFGFDTAVIAGTTGALTRFYDLTPGGLGLTVAIALWGTVLGALLAGFPGDRYGRRDSLRVDGHFLSDLGAGLRVRLGLVLAGIVPVRRRAGDRRILGAGARCTLPKSRRRNGAAAWWGVSSSMSWRESC